MHNKGSWFRFHRSAIHSIKVLSLSEADRWRWVELLCFADENDGSINIKNCSLQLRVTEDVLRSSLERITAALLIERRNGTYFISQWDYRQFRGNADNAERQRRFRARKKNTPQLTSPVT
jgi:hypothetical protein